MRKIVLVLVTLFQVGCLLTRDDIKTAEERKQLAGDVTELRKTNADVQARFDEIQTQQTETVGRIEALERASGVYQDQQKNVLSGQEEKNKIFEDTLKSFEARIINLEKDVNILKMELAKKEAFAKKVSQRPSKQGNYTTAENHFKQKEWRKAILGYEKYRELNPKGRRYADSTYKIGVCFQELGLKAEAKVFYDEVIAKYKGSNEAKKASARLKQLK